MEGDPIRTAICHCYSCQQRTGSVFGTQARFKMDQVVNVEGTATNYKRIGDSGGEIQYKFCPNCGSTVSWTIQGMEEYIVVAIGAFSGTLCCLPVFSVYEARKHSWVVVPENIEHWE